MRGSTTHLFGLSSCAESAVQCSRSMSAPIHTHARSFSGAFGSTLGSSPVKSSLCDFTLIFSVKFSSLEYTSRQKLAVCNSNSSNNYRKKSDFSKQNRRSFIRRRNRDDYEDLEESNTLMSNNGPIVSSFQNQKSQPTLTPGPREREIVELFRKVQTRLCDRAGANKEKKVDSPPGKSKESESVDSLLKLLKKHSIQKGKKNPRINQEMRGSSTKQSTTSFADSTSLEVEISKSHLTRPKSSFLRRSPVPQTKFPSAYTGAGRRKGISLELKGDDIDEERAEFDDKDPLFSKQVVFDKMPEDDDTPESYENENDGDVELNQIVTRNLSGMKATELRALAKNRGIKGFSKLKKNELIVLLSSTSNS